MLYHATHTSALEWAQAGRIEEWIHAYLLSNGNNKPFSDGLKLTNRLYIGPVRLPLSLFHRCCGPEEHMTYRVHAGWWERNVQNLQTAIKNECDLPPLIVHYLLPDPNSNGIFELNDGNKRWEAYTRLGMTDAPVIVWITERHEYENFLANYGKYL